jgi:hypothetical protein
MDFPELPMGEIAQTGGEFGWLADEPELYSDADLVEPAMTEKRDHAATIKGSSTPRTR